MVTRTTRPALWLPPAFFLGLSAVDLLGAPDAGTRMTYAAFTAGSAYWLARARRAGVELDECQLVVRGQLRTHRIPLAEIRSVEAEPMRTASPFSGRWPYVALALDLSDGRHRQFEEVAAPASKRVIVDDIVDAVNDRLPGRS